MAGSVGAAVSGRGRGAGRLGRRRLGAWSTGGKGKRRGEAKGAPGSDGGRRGGEAGGRA
jgi:hypothetical protein